MEDDKNTVINKICSDIVKKDGETEGFPKWRDCGGFEILQCLPNSRDLVVIESSLAARLLKEKLGGSQGKIYIRPLQKVLLNNPVTQQEVPQRMEKCIMCANEVPAKDLRAHLSSCFLEISGDDSGPDDLPPIFNNEDAIPVYLNFLKLNYW